MANRLITLLCQMLWVVLLLAIVSPGQAASATEAAPLVGKGKTVALEYTLFLAEQEMITTNAGQEPLVYEHGNNEILPGLERALEGLKTGDRKQVTVNPEDGYGQVVQEAVVEVDAEKLPPESREIGALVQLNMPGGEVLQGQVTGLHQAKATVDFNHPLAGKTLYFEVKVVEIK